MERAVLRPNQNLHKISYTTLCAKLEKSNKRKSVYCLSVQLFKLGQESDKEKIKMKVKLSLTVLLLVGNVFAGGEVGNGGFAHVCRDSQGKISSARLLDLWGGEELKS